MSWGEYWEKRMSKSKSLLRNNRTNRWYNNFDMALFEWLDNIIQANLSALEFGNLIFLLKIRYLYLIILKIIVQSFLGCLLHLSTDLQLLKLILDTLINKLTNPLVITLLVWFSLHYPNTISLFSYFDQHIFKCVMTFSHDNFTVR